MLLPLLIPVALLLAACSSSSPKSESTSTPVARQGAPVGVCPGDDLRGEGVGIDYQQALVMAQKAIAGQIQSAVSASTHSRVSSVEDSDGNEIIQSSFDMETKVLTNLENAQDARVVLNHPHDGKVKVVACMSRSDAMKPFNLKARVLQDSLHLVAKSYEGTAHPLQKNKAYRSGRGMYIRYMANRNILQGFGMVDPAASAAADADYAYMHNDFSNFLASYAIYFESPENDLEQSVFSVVSQNFNVVGGQCKGGLVLRAGSQNLNCKEGGFGIKCSVSLTLSGSSCDGERYFDLQANVAGTGKYDEAEAMDRLNKNVQKAEWLPEWRRELNRWRLK